MAFLRNIIREHNKTNAEIVFCPFSHDGLMQGSFMRKGTVRNLSDDRRGQSFNEDSFAKAAQQ